MLLNERDPRSAGTRTVDRLASNARLHKVFRARHSPMSVANDARGNAGAGFFFERAMIALPPGGQRPVGPLLSPPPWGADPLGR
jgi:hypothetical protein